MNSEEISITTVQNISEEEGKTGSINTESNNVLKDVCTAICISVFGIIAFCALFCIPWTIIPRTNSIIYQTYWMEAMLPMASNILLMAGAYNLNLATYTQEESLMSIGNFLKIYILFVIPYAVYYILSYAIWTTYFQFNHPLPNLGQIMLPTIITSMIGLWFILPSHLLVKMDFRKKLRNFMLLPLWDVFGGIQNQILIYCFANFPAGFQFPVAFFVAACRGLDKRVRLYVITKMMGIPNESALILVTISVSSKWSFFVAIRLVGAEFATICCTVAIDLFLHLRLTYKCIKEHKKVIDEEIGNENTKKTINIVYLIITELIEGFAPIIYGFCMAMAYYGPNNGILSNVGNNYWSKPIEDISPIFTLMIVLFVIDTLSAVVNSLYIWMIVNVNMIREFYRVLGKYWFFMAIFLASYVSIFFHGNDINFGMDSRRNFEWISNKGWRNLLNCSSDLTNEQKRDLFTQMAEI